MRLEWQKGDDGPSREAQERDRQEARGFRDQGGGNARGKAIADIITSVFFFIFIGTMVVTVPLVAIGGITAQNGAELVEAHPLFQQVARERGLYSEDLMKRIAEKGSIKKFAEIPEDVREVFVPAEPERELRQVVRPEREELGVLGDPVGRDRRARHFDHRADEVGQLHALLRHRLLGDAPHDRGLVLQLGRFEQVDGLRLCSLFSGETLHHLVQLGEHPLAEQHGFLDRAAAVGVDPYDRIHLETAGQEKECNCGKYPEKAVQYDLPVIFVKLLPPGYTSLLKDMFFQNEASKNAGEYFRPGFIDAFDINTAALAAGLGDAPVHLDHSRGDIRGAAFHAAILPRLEKHFGTSLVKISRSLWTSPDEAVLVSCRVSKCFNRFGTK